MPKKKKNAGVPDADFIEDAEDTSETELKTKHAQPAKDVDSDLEDLSEDDEEDLLDEVVDDEEEGGDAY